MPRFNQLKLLNVRWTIFGAAIIIAALIGALVSKAPALNAATTYTYASSGSKITVNHDGDSSSLSKQPIQTQGKDDYRGVVEVDWQSGDTCMLGIQVLVTPGAASGRVSSPAFLNGIPGAGGGGANYVQSCPKDFAATQSAFNANVTIAGSVTDTTPPPSGSETAGQREALVTVYSPVKDPVAASITMSITGKSGTDKKNLTWGSSNSVSSIRWSDIDAGTEMKFCITPIAVFDTQSCKTATKQRGQALLVQFGTFENSYNPDGKTVNVDVNLNIPNTPSATTYGPISLVLYKDGKSSGTTLTDSREFGLDTGVTAAQKYTLKGTFGDIEPGSYKVCIEGHDDLCSPVFTKQANLSVRTSIDVSEEATKGLATGSTATTCAIEGVGWIICPVTNFLAGVADNVFTFLSENFLQVDTSMVSASSPAYKVWSSVRAIANIAFVIAFLIIIFSQLTGQGIANYGIKKMLPRLVVAAILVNVSFFVCQIAIDLSNLLGVSIKQIFDAMGDSVTLPTTVGSENGTWVGLAAAVLAGAGIAWALGISVLLPFLIGAVVAFIMVFLILVVRQVLIVLLVVVAPIAFVAYLLPNTEQWFTKWRKMFVALLLVFPLIGLLFGAAGLAAQVINAAAFSSAGDTFGNDASAWIAKIVAAGVIALPLFLLPSLLRKSLDAVGNIGSTMNKIGGNIGKSASSKTANSGLVKNFASRKAEKRASISNGTYSGWNPISKTRTGINRALNRNRAFNAVTSGYGATRTLVGQGEQRKDAQEAMALFAGNDSLVEAWASSGGDIDKIPSSITAGMTPQQKEQLMQQFVLMRNAGHGKKATSFLAAAQYLSENGKGDAVAVKTALDNASRRGASNVEVGSAAASAVAAYRKSGRGDAVGQLNDLTGMVKNMTMDQGWTEVAASAVHRDGIKVKRDDKTGAIVSTSDGYKAYETFLASKEEYTRKAVEGFDRMETRAQKNAYEAIIIAAQNHQAKKTGTASTITDIKSAKTYFKIK